MHEEEYYMKKFNLLKCFLELNFKDIEEKVIDCKYSSDDKYMFMRKLLFHMETAYIKSDPNSKDFEQIIKDIHKEIKSDDPFEINGG